MATIIEWEDYLAEDKPFPTATDQDIVQLEQKIGYSLPGDFKLVLKAHQGQAPIPESLPVGDGHAPFDCLFHAFLSGPDMTYSITANTERLSERGFENYVPFASAGGSYYCFDYNTSDTNPPVVFIDGDFGPEDERAYITIARSFTELLDMLGD